jgi:hypothetical protein
VREDGRIVGGEEWQSKESSHSALTSGIGIRIKNKICTNPQIKKP